MRTRFKIAATALTAALVPVGMVAAGQSAEAAPAFPAHYAAPYLQIDSSDAGDMAADMKATGLKYYTLAFLTPKSGCTPEWEDDGDTLNKFTSQVASLQSAGGN